MQYEINKISKIFLQKLFLLLKFNPYELKDLRTDKKCLCSEKVN